MLKEQKHLYELGYAIHLLRPRSKSPIKSGWTKGPRAERAEIAASYREGMNIGVRLGAASKINTHYLAVVDCDVKSEDPKHRREMEDRLKLLLPELDLETNPHVHSGRGNGSAHHHVLTTSPCTPALLARSNDRVKVKILGSKPSKIDEQLLTPEERANGIRTRNAWEISLMGEGQQVVLPPSVHPDTHKTYEWMVEVKPDGSNFTILNENPEVKKARTALNTTPNYNDKITILDSVDISRLKPEIQDKILNSAKGSRSEDALSIAFHMRVEGYTEDEVLTVLTDISYGIGEVAMITRKPKIGYAPPVGV
jgi:hypothetical protein